MDWNPHALSPLSMILLHPCNDLPFPSRNNSFILEHLKDATHLEKDLDQSLLICWVLIGCDFTSSFTVPNSGSRDLKWYLKLPCLSTAALKSCSVTCPSLAINSSYLDQETYGLNLYTMMLWCHYCCHLLGMLTRKGVRERSV